MNRHRLPPMPPPLVFVLAALFTLVVEPACSNNEGKPRPVDPPPCMTGEDPCPTPKP